MTETPNRRTASTAAREFLQTKVDRVGDLSEAARAIDAALEARAAADRHVTECQRAYGQARRMAIAAGWTDSELDQLGWPPEHGPQPRRRGRPATSGRPAQRPAAREPGPADAGDAAATASTTSVERESGNSSGEPSGAPPDDPYPARPQALAHEAAPPPGYPDPQPVD